MPYGSLAEWIIGIKDRAEGVQLVDSALGEARRAATDVAASIDYLLANAEQVARFCSDETRVADVAGAGCGKSSRAFAPRTARPVRCRTGGVDFLRLQ